ncbi:riboflavin biosynthesis protein [Elysia marginata]|uniref:Bifunctional riboflavin kinase/FMN adenylyltransferase n=1 Tax=Elysia marginata TaxID=1093978 RepID=A0AAV4GWY2_9GAST|nr:riboflavin biosynthesis protein [Elysia marginata]
MEAEDFVNHYLVKKLKVRHVVIGYDHRFGKEGRASVEDFMSFGKKYGFSVEKIDAQSVGGNIISSTKIREFLSEGKISESNSILGYNYKIFGTVIKGDKIGRKIGFPTANIEVKEKCKLLPKDGVYMVLGHIKRDAYYGIMNIGKRPTFGKGEKRVECHFLDFGEDIYGEEIFLEVFKYIREERCFKSMEDLKLQIEKDRQEVLQRLSSGAGKK